MTLTIQISVLYYLVWFCHSLVYHTGSHISASYGLTIIWFNYCPNSVEFILTNVVTATLLHSHKPSYLQRSELANSSSRFSQ